jgi:peptidoglycan/xylan/chitin deacetylase (PgdA/CDA1 family)
MALDAGTIIGEGLGALAVAGLAAGGCVYASLWPGSQIFGRTLIAPRRPDEIALTFDDGPNPAWTPRLLELLAKHDVKATFFLIGKYAAEETVLTRYIANGGHAIGNHSWSHPDLSRTWPGKVREELRRTKDTLEGITGKSVRLFRPPYGARRPDVLKAARAMGMEPVLWNAMTNDWDQPPAQAIVERLVVKVERTAERGQAANIVLHDGGSRMLGADRGPSVKAAEMLIERFQGSRRFVTVEEWG